MLDKYVGSTTRSLLEAKVKKLNEYKAKFVKSRTTQYGDYISRKYSYFSDKTIGVNFLLLLLCKAVLGWVVEPLIWSINCFRSVKIALLMFYFGCVEAPFVEEFFKQRMTSQIIKKEQQIENVPRYGLNRFKKVIIGRIIGHNFAFVEKYNIIGLGVWNYTNMVVESLELAIESIIAGSVYHALSYLLMACWIFAWGVVFAVQYYNFIRSSHTTSADVANETDLDGRTFPLRSNYTHFYWNHRLSRWYMIKVVIDMLSQKYTKHRPYLVLLKYLFSIIPRVEGFLIGYVGLLIKGYYDPQYESKQNFKVETLNPMIYTFERVMSGEAQRQPSSVHVYDLIRSLRNQFIAQVNKFRNSLETNS